ncbi:hypothetical protein SKAU_G00160360 [Synaphobranchus kaupii]|uniref:Myozenin 1 n=1 Tax=Synaphobranchus kaupii TaxID=118154 RepID=A0A9Q1FIJ9_SYNKA|nr:hypothetical protein SKAU_G00160360 [Synaphobranchus kaupii]
MPLSGTPAPNKRKKSSRLITDLSHIAQDEYMAEPEASEFDLGKKIRTPKDIMLEELSLMKNKGSLMFKMRQKRVEKFIYENNPDVFTQDSMDHFQELVPSLGGKMDVGGQLVNGHMVGYGYAGSGSKAPGDTPRGKAVSQGEKVRVNSTAQATWQTANTTARVEQRGEHGAGGSLAKKKCENAKTYVSPWERAMKGNEELTATMKVHMPGPEAPHNLRMYKCFNRSALPYGGFDKASQLMTFQLPEVNAAIEDLEPTIVYQHDINSRPSFNRTPIGWIGSGETSHIHVEMETMPFDGETDEL